MLAISFLIAYVRNVFDSTSAGQACGILCDAFFIPGVLMLCMGILVVCSNGGTFDMLAYGIRAFFALFNKEARDRKYPTFYDYRKAKQDKPHSFWYMIIIGGAFVAVSIVLLLLYYKL